MTRKENVKVTIEKWRIIEDFSEYSVSNYGRVKKNKTNHILSFFYPNGQYTYVRLWKNGKAFNCRVHRLVAKAFIPNPQNKKTVNHKDFNINNNKVDNLEWMTQQENCLYSSKHFSEAHIGKSKSEQHRINIMKRTIKTNPNHHLYKNKNSWMVRCKNKEKWICKTFLKKEDAIKFRDNIFKDLEKTLETNEKWIIYKEKQSKK